LSRATTLVVPVPEAEAAVGAWRQRYDVWARRGFPAHVTVRGPFLPLERIDDAVIARLEAVVAEHPPSDFAFASVRVIPGAVLLVPEPDELFRSLAAALFHEWPEAARRRTAARLVGPHLTVARSASLAALLRVRRRLAPLLPIAARASEVRLVTLADPAQTVGRFELGAD
jgi:hypothetical protein